MNVIMLQSAVSLLTSHVCLIVSVIPVIVLLSSSYTSTGYWCLYSVLTSVHVLVSADVLRGSDVLVSVHVQTPVDVLIIIIIIEFV